MLCRNGLLHHPPAGSPFRWTAVIVLLSWAPRSNVRKFKSGAAKKKSLLEKVSRESHSQRKSRIFLQQDFYFRVSIVLDETNARHVAIAFFFVFAKRKKMSGKKLICGNAAKEGQQTSPPPQGKATTKLRGRDKGFFLGGRFWAPSSYRPSSSSHPGAMRTLRKHPFLD